MNATAYYIIDSDLLMSRQAPWLVYEELLLVVHRYLLVAKLFSKLVVLGKRKCSARIVSPNTFSTQSVYL